MEGLFDEYLSLGSRCETSFQIRRALGRDESCFFGWGVFDLTMIRVLIRLEFASIFRAENIGWDPVDHLAKDRLYGFTFHGPWDAHNGPPPHLDPDFDAHLEDVQARGRHLVHKFWNPKGRRAYFYRLNSNPQAWEVDQVAAALAEISPDDRLVILRRPNDPPTGATHPMVRERVLQFFAPDFNCDLGGDHASWDAVFAEFPHSDLIRERIAA